VALRRTDDDPAPNLGDRFGDPKAPAKSVDGATAKASGLAESKARPPQQQRQDAIAIARHAVWQDFKLVGAKEPLLGEGEPGE
jgi:hypothetical protein